MIISSLRGQNDFHNQIDSLIHLGIELSIQHNYEKAESVFVQLINDRIDNPAGYFFMAAMIQSRMMDFETVQWDQDFQEYIRLAIHHAKKQPSHSDDSDLWSMFYHGSALCYAAFYEGRKHDYWDAIRHGVLGISIIKKIIALQPDFYDAYFGIGSFKYWKSRLTKNLKWLPLLSDEREEGLQLVRIAVKNGTYTRHAARNELIWMLLDAGQSEEAYSLALEGLEKFPQSRFFLWGAAKSAFALNRFQEASRYYSQLLLSITSAPVNNHYNEYLCRVSLARCFDQLGQYSEAKYQIKVLETLPLSPEIEKKLKQQRKYMAQMKKRLFILVKSPAPSDSLITKYNATDQERCQ